MESELEFWLKRLEQTPNDDKVLTALAFYYLENPDGDKDIEYFEKACFANPTLENTHNYAFWLSQEYGKHDKAIHLQQQVLAMQPQSDYPFSSHAQSLTAKKWEDDTPYDKTLVKTLLNLYIEASLKLKNSSSESFLNRFSQLKIKHNIAICLFLLDDFTQAEKYFYQAYQLLDLPMDVPDGMREEEKYYLMHDLVKFYLLTGDIEQATYWLNKAQSSSCSDKLDTAQLYSRLGDYQQAYNVMRNDLNFHESWDWILLAIYKTNPAKWQEYYQTQIADFEGYMKEAESELQAAKASKSQSEIKELEDRIQHHLSEINKFQKVLESNKPLEPIILKKEQEFHFRYFGCLLFGCPRHHNLANDKAI